MDSDMQQMGRLIVCTMPLPVHSQILTGGRVAHLQKNG